MTKELNHYDDEQDSCIIPSNLIPEGDLPRYRVERDFHLEQDIANYVQGEAQMRLCRMLRRSNKKLC